MVNHSDLIADILARTFQACKKNDNKITPEIVEEVEKSVRADWGGDRYFVAKKMGGDNSERNGKILRDYTNGERIAFLSRRYNLTERRILQIIRPTK